MMVSFRWFIVCRKQFISVVYSGNHTCMAEICIDDSASLEIILNDRVTICI